MNCTEISKAFEPYVFKDDSPCTPVYKWEGINEFRSYVLPSLVLGLTEVVSKYASQGSPIIEIGSGEGYTFSNSLLQTIVRTQICYSECKLFCESSSETIYQMDIENIYETLKFHEIKIPLIFGLNVFDTLLSDVRKKSLLQISKIQNVGDRILSLHDANPYLDTSFARLKEVYPGSTAIPYFPKNRPMNKFSMLLVPSILDDRKYSVGDLCVMFLAEAREAMKSKQTEVQKRLEILKSENDLEEIDLEEFYIEQIKNDFEEAGYKTHIYYHTAFTMGNPKVCIDKDILYRHAIDTIPLRKWNVENPFFANLLQEKGIEMPVRVEMKEGSKILGAEILVIEATKFGA